MNKLRETTGTAIMETLCSIAVFITFLATVCYAGYTECHYRMECYVIEVHENLEVVIKDKTDNKWTVIADNLTVGNRVVAIFNDNHTESRTDDIIEDLILRGNKNK